MVRMVRNGFVLFTLFTLSTLVMFPSICMAEDTTNTVPSSDNSGNSTSDNSDFGPQLWCGYVYAACTFPCAVQALFPEYPICLKKCQDEFNLCVLEDY